MTENRKALFFDIDGTLFSEVNREVPESARRAIRMARSNGHLVFINSGRTYCLLGVIKDILEVDGYCCGCGTRVLVGEDVLYSAALPHDVGLKVKENIIKHKLEGVLEGTEACYFAKGPYRIPQMEAMRASVAKSGAASPYGWDEDCYDFDKFCVMSDEESDVPGFVRELGLGFDVINRGGGFYECIPAGHSKATAIDVVLEHYGIPLSNAYVFGDSTNDLSMFEHVPNAILMGHHDVELEPYATFFTKNVEADGVAYALEMLKII